MTEVNNFVNSQQQTVITPLASEASGQEQSGSGSDAASVSEGRMRKTAKYSRGRGLPKEERVPSGGSSIRGASIGPPNTDQQLPQLRTTVRLQSPDS